MGICKSWGKCSRSDENKGRAGDLWWVRTAHCRVVYTRGCMRLGYCDDEDDFRLFVCPF